MANAELDEKTLFLLALEIDDFAERDQFLVDACGEDTFLLERTRSLLAKCAESDDDTLESERFRVLTDGLQSLAAEWVGQHCTIEDQGVLTEDLGDYHITEEIGRGAVGVVFRAKQKSMNREVALKLIFGAALAFREERERIQREAKLAASLSHPNIVPIFDVGHEKGCDYCSMALIGGGTLADLAKRKRLTHRESVSLMIFVADAVDTAHEQGVIHCDIKPQNILIDPDEKPRVSDFGLASRMEKETSPVMTGYTLGTSHYMAPEQTMGENGRLSKSVDIYCMGAVLYELLTGSHPHAVDALFGTLERIKTDSPKKLQRTDTPIDQDLEAVVLKCLRKNSNSRYATAGDFKEDLEAWLQGRDISVRPLSAFGQATRWLRRLRL